MLNRFNMTTEWKSRAVALVGWGSDIVVGLVAAVLVICMFGAWIENVLVRING